MKTLSMQVRIRYVKNYVVYTRITYRLILAQHTWSQIEIQELCHRIPNGVVNTTAKLQSEREKISILFDFL